MSHCLLTGGSSQIGYFLLPELLAADASVQVLALARRARPDYLATHERLCWHIAGAADADFSQAAPITEIISLGPLQLTLDAMPHCVGLQRVVAVTSSSIVIKQDSVDAFEREQIRALAAAEQSLIERCQQHGIVCQILRPTMIYGAGLDANVCALAKLAAGAGVVPLAGRAAGLRRPVHAADIAAAVLRLRQLAQSGRWIVTGGSTLSYRELAENVCRTLRRGRVIGVPAVVLQTLLSAAHFAGRLRSVNAGMIARQNQDLLFDDRAAIKDFGWSPRAFQLTAAILRAPQQPWQPDC